VKRGRKAAGLKEDGRAAEDNTLVYPAFLVCLGKGVRKVGGEKKGPLMVQMHAFHAYISKKGEGDMNAKRIALTLGFCMLLFQGTASGIVGVDDNVPGQELIFPFICEGTTGAASGDPPVFGTLTTLWSYAETQGQDTMLYIYVRDKNGVMVLDYADHLTPRDVSSGDCQSVVQMMSPSAKSQLLVTIEGKSYFAGYLTVSKHFPDDEVNNLIGWVTLYDPNLSNDNRGYTAANFKPYQAEGRADPNTFGEAIGDGPMYADEYYLRYNILNSNAETYNWWIVLRGASFCDGKPPELCQSTTRLYCIICNEEETCISQTIPVPYRLNIINPEDYISPVLGTGYPKKGFGYFALAEQGFTSLPGVITNVDGYFENQDFTAFMWSYQRQQRPGKIPYPVDPKKLDKFDFKYGPIYDNELWSVIDPADRLWRTPY
jgi:hypothetical protein